MRKPLGLAILALCSMLDLTPRFWIENGRVRCSLTGQWGCNLGLSRLGFWVLPED